jgi:copper chaperone CopZ
MDKTIIYRALRQMSFDIKQKKEIMKIYVKNMACESCVIFVKEALEELDIKLVKVRLGEIETKEDVSDEDKIKLNNKIKKVG